MIDENFYVVILAGGSGTLLWPLSRLKMPKQLLPILDDRSMLALTIDRARALVPAERIWIVTVADQKQEIARELFDLGISGKIKVIEEPAGKNTAAAIGLAAVQILQENPAGIMAVFSSDHHIGRPSEFFQALEAAQQAACLGWLVTIGI